MKISPDLQYHIVFWIFTIPIVPIAILAVTVGIVLPTSSRLRLVRFIEILTSWRNNVKLVVYYRNKANLFSILKG
jgi:hypothetical protein